MNLVEGHSSLLVCQVVSGHGLTSHGETISTSEYVVRPCTPKHCSNVPTKHTNREFSMQHVRRAVVCPVRCPGMFTQETLTSRTGQTGATGPNYAGNSFAT